MSKEAIKTSKIYIPTSKPEDWRKLLADPVKHWRTGFSAKTLACSWQEPNGFPESVKRVFKNSDM